MDFNIRVYKVDKEDSNLKGFVSISPGKSISGNAEVSGL